MLKVIIESSILTDDEIEKAVKICIESGADYVKTSTGFSNGGATEKAVEIIKKAVHLNGFFLRVYAALIARFL